MELTSLLQQISLDPIEGYFHLAKKFPDLFFNSSAVENGAEIIFDKSEILSIQHEMYLKYLKKGISPALAMSWSQAGVVKFDEHIIWLRDPIQCKNGEKTLYKRFLYTYLLCKGKAVAIFPIWENKVILLRIWRHSTQSWELEVPRGAPNPQENPSETALRELQEETGYIGKKIVSLGVMCPDNGLLAHDIEIFFIESSGVEIPCHDKYEIVSDVKHFELEKVEEFLKKPGYFRDPYLFYAFYQSKNLGLI